MPTVKEKAKAAADKAAAKVLADAAKKKAAKDKVTTKKAKDKAAQAAASEAKAKGAQSTALKNLAPVAKEINTRMEKASKMEDDAYDHRLAAALKLAEAKDACDKAKIKFKGWVEDNVEQTYDTARKLVAIGKSDDPVAALEDLRVKNKLANAALRERQSIAPPKKPGKKAVATGKKTGPVETPATRAMKGLAAMDDEAAVNLIKSTAENHGLAVVTADQAKAARRANDKAAVGVVAQLKTLFTTAGGSDQMAFVKWAVGEVGAELVDGFEATTTAASVEDLTEIPAALQRPVAEKGTRRKAA